MPTIQRSNRDGKKFMVKYKNAKWNEVTKHWWDSNGTIASSWWTKAKGFQARHDGKTLWSWLAKMTRPTASRAKKVVWDSVSIPSRFK